MKEIKRVVSTSLWDDDLVLQEFSPEDKYFMLYLLTNRYTSQLGIYHLPIIQASRDLGYSIESVNVLIDRFQNKYDLIRYSEKTNEVAIKNYLRHSIVKGGKPVMDCLIKEEKQVKDKTLIMYVVKHMDNYLDDDKVIPTVKEYISNYITNNNITTTNVITNDNDNERIVDVTLTNRHKTTKKYFNDIQLNDAYLEYLTMRKKIKRPIATDEAIVRNISKLEKLSNGDNKLAILILNQSVDNCWQGLFEYKGEYVKTESVENTLDDYQ